LQAHLPETLAAHVVAALRATVASKTDAKHCVATIPPRATAAQRKALVDVLKGSGLHVQQLLSESVAAVLAYGCGQTPEAAPEDVLVFDMGASQVDRGGFFPCLFLQSWFLRGKRGG
jgi:molecular chaperone DnaK (HSP70)